MMWEVMLYAVGVAAALSLMGYCEERLAFMRNLPRRWVWPLMMVLSIAWVAGAMLLARPAVVATPGLELVVTPSGELDVVPVAAPATSGAPAAIAGVAPANTPPAETSWSPPSDRALLLAWAGASALLFLSLFVAGALLRQRSATWRRARVRGREVMVSESIGPALMGIWQPRIVVPEWFMTETPARQELILQHEEQHIAARDPLLLRAATLLTLVLPWNLPLWWQLRRLRRAIEMDCDGRVLRQGVSPVEYGSVLLAVTRRCADVPAGLIAMSESASALEHRVRNLLPDPSRHSVWRAGAALLLWMVGVGAAVGLEAPPLPQREESAVPLLPPPPADSDWRTNTRQALVDRHPELFSGAQPAGVTFVIMVLRPDGSVASSEARHVPQPEVAARTTAISKTMKNGFGLLIYGPGAPIAEGVTTRNPLRVFVDRPEPALDDDSLFSKADVAAALERHLPDALDDPGTRPQKTPWLILSREGDVIRSGYIRQPGNSFDVAAFNAQVPDLNLCDYQIVQNVRMAGARTGARKVILAWVQAAGAAGAAPSRREAIERTIVEHLRTVMLVPWAQSS